MLLFLYSELGWGGKHSPDLLGVLELMVPSLLLLTS